MQTITTPAGIYTPPATALIQKVQLRIFESCPSATLCLMQYDRALPVIAVELFEGGNPYKVPENAAVNIRMVKPDKTTVYNPALGVSSDRKTTYIGITPQMTACFGSCAATLEIALNDGVLGTGLLRLNIEKNPVSEDAVESSDEYLSLQEIVNKVQTYADQASTAAELAMNSVQAVVSVNAQTFTKEQKAQARANIGAVGYDAQNIDPGQQLQARKNIGAASVTQLTEAMETSAQALQKEKEELRAKFGTPEVLEASVYSAADASYTPKALTLTENAVAGVTVHGVTNVWGTGEPAPDNACPIEGLGMLDTEYVLTGAENWQQDGAVYKYFIPETLYGEDPYTNQLCSHAPWGVGGSNVFARVYRADAGSYIAMGAGLYDCLAQQAAAGTPVKIWFRKTGHTAADPYYTGVKLEDAAGFHAFAVKTEQPLFSRSVLESDLLLDGKRCSRLTALYGQLLLDGTQEMWTDHSLANTVKVTLFADMKYSAAGDVRARCSRLPYNGDSTLDTPHFCFSESLGQVHLFLPKSVFAQQDSTEAVRAYFAAECAAGNPYVVVAPWQTEKVSYTDGETGVRNAAGTVTLETGGRTFITTWAAAREADLRALSAKAMRTDAQALTQEQQLQIRENIDAAKKNHAASSAEYGMGDSVNFGHVRLYESVTSRATTGAAVTPLAVYNAIRDAAAKCVSVGTQTLTEEQKAQARVNIGAAAVGEGGGWVQPDWEAAEGVDGHIKNRTHWVDWEYTEAVAEKTLSYPLNGNGLADYNPTAYKPVDVGSWVVVTWDGVAYRRKAYLYKEKACIGNAGAFYSDAENTGEPFFMYKSAVGTMIIAAVGKEEGKTATHTYKLEMAEPTYHKLDNSYLDLDWIPKLENRSIAYSGKLIADEMDGELLKFTMPEEFELENGVSYTVQLGSNIANNIKCFYAQVGVQQRYYLGNAHLIDSQYTDTGETFCFCETAIETVAVRIILAEKPYGYELGVTEMQLNIIREGKVPQMPPMYLPDVAVRATGQRLTDEQKAQVRANIGAAAVGEGGGGGAPADWSAAEGEAGHVKNRTHWTEPRQTILEEVQTESGDEGYTALIMSPVGLEPGKTYVVVCDGTEYECVGQDISSLMGMPGVVGLGDLANLGMAGNGEPFIAMAASVELDPGVYGMIMTFSPCTVAIYGDSVHKLDNKYLDLDWLPKISTPATMFVGSLSTSSKQNGYLKFETPDTVSLVDGHTYDVRLNGDKYTCTCYTQLNNGNVVRLLGNAILADGVKDTGEPFCFVETKLDDVTVRMLLTVDYDWFELGASSIYLSVTGYGVLNRLPYELMPANVPYADDGAAILLPTFRQTFPAGQLTGLGELTMAPPQLNFVEGRTYTVTWDGAEYICEARRLEGEMDGAYMSAVVIGNAAVFGSADTEEPFLIGTLSSPRAADVLISLWDVDVKHEVSIHSGAVKRLNEACMPQAVNRIVLRSNINGSNKKFAITVNDQGELEVNAL